MPRREGGAVKGKIQRLPEGVHEPAGAILENRVGTLEQGNCGAAQGNAGEIQEIVEGNQETAGRSCPE